MSRLYDRLLVKGPRRSATGMEFLWEDVRRALPDAPVFSIDNVAEMFFVHPSKETWTLGVDFPVLAPPYQDFWMEYEVPSRILGPNDRMVASRSLKMPRHVGVFFHGHSAEEVRKYPYVNTAARSLVRLPGVHWILEGILFVEDYEPYEIHGPLATWFIALDEKGTVVTGEDGTPQAVLATGLGPRTTDIDPGLSNVLGRLYVPVFLGLTFLHCKNVSTHERTTPRHLSQKFRSRYKKEPVRYHVLSIDPMRRILESEGRSKEQGLHHALHLCRGHFRTYDDRPLFGKVRGTFWIPQHLRGSKSEGMVLKDYEVKSPRDS